jgi:hypothetical protein
MVGGLMIGILDSISSLSSGVSDNYPVLWLDAAKGVNDGTAVDGHAVYDWADQSGNGNDFLQTSASYQPIYNTATGINGLPTLTFYPNKRLQLSDTILFYSEYTIYAVVQTLATQNQTVTYKVFYQFSTCGIYCQTLGRVGLAYDNPNATTPAPAPASFRYYDRIGLTAIIDYDTDPHLFTISNGKVAGVSKKQIYADGNLEIDGGGYIDSSLGLEHFLGFWNNQIGNFEFAELIVYKSKHSDAKRETVELYLINKYGL